MTKISPPFNSSTSCLGKEEEPTAEALGNSDILRRIGQFALTPKKYFVAMLDKQPNNMFGMVQFPCITVTSCLRWRPQMVDRGAVVVDETLIMEDPIPVGDGWARRNFIFAIDNDIGTIAVRSSFKNGPEYAELIAYYRYAPGQQPRYYEVPEDHIVRDVCIVNKTVFLATTLGFGCVDFSEEEPSYEPICEQRYYKIAKTNGFIFAIQCPGLLEDSGNKVDCFKLAEGCLPEQLQRWIVPSPHHSFVASYKFPAIENQNNCWCMAMLSPNYSPDASLRLSHVESWMLSRSSFSTTADTDIVFVQLSLNAVTEPKGVVTSKSRNEIFVAAGRQGLLLVPMMFESNTQPTVLFQPAGNQTVLGVQLHNDIPYVLVKEDDGDGLGAYTIVKVDDTNNNLTWYPIPQGDQGYEGFM